MDIGSLSIYYSLCPREKSALAANLEVPVYRDLILAAHAAGAPRRVVRHLAVSPPDRINVPFRGGHRPRELAPAIAWIAYKNPHLMPLAVDAGADVNTDCPSWLASSTSKPLIFAVASGDVTLVARLIAQGAVVDTSALWAAVHKKSTTLIHLLVSHGATVAPGMLVWPCVFQDRDLFETLVTYGSDPNKA